MSFKPPILGNEPRSVARRRTLCAGAAALCCGSTVLIGCESFQSDPKQEARLAWDAQRAALKYEQASADLYRGRVGDAIHLAGEAVTLSPTQPAHGELLARAYIAHGDHNAARRVLETLRESHPQFAAAAYLLGTIFERQRDWDRAVDAFRQAVALEPDVLEHLLAFAQAVAQRGDAIEAMRILRDQLERFGSDAAYHLARAELAREAGELAAACDSYGRALALGIDDPPTRRSLALCLHWLGRHREALLQLEPLVLDQPSPDQFIMSAYAASLLATRQFRHAADWLQRFTTQRPTAGSLWLLLARTHEILHERDDAIAAARRATSFLPDSAEAHVVLAALLLADRNPREAERVIRLALALDDSKVEALLVHGRVYERLGDRAAAGESYRLALQLDPEHALATQLLSRLTE